jgi:3-hydroxybutyryl-CoA dehydrogenase
MTEQIKHIAVIGAGYMGGGIAQVFGMAGMDVVIMDADPDITARHLDRLRQEAEDFENRGLLEPGSAELVRKNLRAANSVAEAVADADFIEEAVLERPDVKGPVLRSIEEAARPDAVIGSNTSTLPIGDLAAGLTHPERFLGVHFSNPAPFIPGVELIAHARTDEDVVKAVEALVPLTGKLTARVRDKAGFVLNRLQYVLLKPSTSSRRASPHRRTSTLSSARRSATVCRSLGLSPSPTWRAWTFTATASTPCKRTTASAWRCPRCSPI